MVLNREKLVRPTKQKTKNAVQLVKKVIRPNMGLDVPLFKPVRPWPDWPVGRRGA